MLFGIEIFDLYCYSGGFKIDTRVFEVSNLNIDSEGTLISMIALSKVSKIDKWCVQKELCDKGKVENRVIWKNFLRLSRCSEKYSKIRMY